MFRNSDTNASLFVRKFKDLKEKLSAVSDTPLDIAYYKELASYIDRLYTQIISIEEFDDKMLDEIREPEMSNLNRLQKLKNGKSYKKEKHKGKDGEWE